MSLNKTLSPGRRRRFILRVVVPTIVVAAVSYLLVRVTSQPVYEAASLLKFEPAARSNLPQYTAELETAVQLLTSHNVLTAALTDPRLASLRSLRKAGDPEVRLRKRLKVVVIPNSYLARVSAEGNDPYEPALIVNAVTHAFLNAVSEPEEARTREQVRSLERYKQELDAQAEEKQHELLLLARQAEDLNLDSEQGQRLTPERLNRFAADYDGAVAARIKTEAAVEVTRRIGGKRGARGARFDELEAQLAIDQATEKAFLDRLRSARKTSDAEGLKPRLVREDLDGLRAMQSTVNKRLEHLRFDTDSQPKIAIVSEARANDVPYSNGGPVRLALAFLATLAGFGLLWGNLVRQERREERLLGGDDGI